MYPQLIKIAHSCSPDEKTAIVELQAGLLESDIVLIILFCSVKYNLDLLAEEIAEAFKEIMVCGCTAGCQIGSEGYSFDGISGVSFSSKVISNFAVSRIENLQSLDVANLQKNIQLQRQQLQKNMPTEWYGKGGNKRGINTFALLCAMTANAMKDDRERCLAAGMNDYISKPITLDSLRTVLLRWLSPPCAAKE